MPPPSSAAVLLVLLAAILLVVLGAALSRRAVSRRTRGRARVAVRGEAEAAALLEDAGYVVEGRGVERQGALLIDGQRVAFGVRADLLARCPRGRLHVVEVKTGGRAPDPLHGPTRRQLLEYALVFGSRRILLVDMEARRILAIGFEPLVQIEAGTTSTRSPTAIVPA
jgi:hypothetical protein